MVAAATTVAFGMNAQDASVETQAIGVSDRCTRIGGCR